MVTGPDGTVRHFLLCAACSHSDEAPCHRGSYPAFGADEGVVQLQAPDGSGLPLFTDARPAVAILGLLPRWDPKAAAARLLPALTAEEAARAALEARRVAVKAEYPSVHQPLGRCPPIQAAIRWIFRAYRSRHPLPCAERVELLALLMGVASVATRVVALPHPGPPPPRGSPHWALATWARRAEGFLAAVRVSCQAAPVSAGGSASEVVARFDLGPVPAAPAALAQWVASAASACGPDPYYPSISLSRLAGPPTSAKDPRRPPLVMGAPARSALRARPRDRPQPPTAVRRGSGAEEPGQSASEDATSVSSSLSSSPSPAREAGTLGGDPIGSSAVAATLGVGVSAVGVAAGAGASAEAAEAPPAAQPHPRDGLQSGTSDGSQAGVTQVASASVSQAAVPPPPTHARHAPASLVLDAVAALSGAGGRSSDRPPLPPPPPPAVLAGASGSAQLPAVVGTGVQASGSQGDVSAVTSRRSASVARQADASDASRSRTPDPHRPSVGGRHARGQQSVPQSRRAQIATDLRPAPPAAPSWFDSALPAPSHALHEASRFSLSLAVNEAMDQAALSYMRTVLPEALEAALKWLADRATRELRFGAVFRDEFADAYGRVLPVGDYALLVWTVSGARQEIVDDLEGRLTLETLRSLTDSIELFPPSLHAPSPKWVKMAFQWVLLAWYAGVEIKDTARGDFAPTVDLSLERLGLWESYRHGLLRSLLVLARNECGERRPTDPVSQSFRDWTEWKRRGIIPSCPHLVVDARLAAHCEVATRVPQQPSRRTAPGSPVEDGPEAPTNGGDPAGGRGRRKAAPPSPVRAALAPAPAPAAVATSSHPSIVAVLSSLPGQAEAAAGGERKSRKRARDPKKGVASLAAAAATSSRASSAASAGSAQAQAQVPPPGRTLPPARPCTECQVPFVPLRPRHVLCKGCSDRKQASPPWGPAAGPQGPGAGHPSPPDPRSSAAHARPSSGPPAVVPPRAAPAAARNATMAALVPGHPSPHPMQSAGAAAAPSPGLRACRACARQFLPAAVHFHSCPDCHHSQAGRVTPLADPSPVSATQTQTQS